MSKILFLPKSKQTQLVEYMPKQSTLDKLASFFSVFSDATRIKILTALTLSELCVNDLSVMLELNQTTVSHQLQFLRSFRAVKCRRDGKIMYYSIADNNISDVMLNGVNFLISE